MAIGFDPRGNTNALLGAIEEGLVDRDYVLLALVNYLSDSDVRQMCLANDILLDEFEWE